MAELPFSCEPPAHPDQPGSPATEPRVGRARPVSPPNVWLCADPPGVANGEFPRWARRVIHTLSEPCESVIIRALRGYPGLAEDVAVLLGVAAATGRRPVALLPTPCLAARTRALLRHPTHNRAPEPGTVESVAGEMAGRHAGEAQLAGHPMATGHPADTETYPGHSAATSRCPVAGPPPAITTATGVVADTGPSPDTSPATDTSPAAATDRCMATNRSVPAVVRVGVGRRRAWLEHGPAAAVIVLAGPVGPDARLPRRAQRSGLPSARLLAAWARVLEPGGVIGVLSPPPMGRHRRGGERRESAPVPGLGQRGLMWSDRIVLVHAGSHTRTGSGTEAGGLGHHQPPRPPHTPFAPVHSYLDLYESDLIDPASPPDPGGLAGRGEDGTWR